MSSGHYRYDGWQMRRMSRDDNGDEAWCGGIIGVTARLGDLWWQHQIDAANTVVGFLDTAEAQSAALISMPTGSGKTGVVARFVAESPRSWLVVVPHLVLVRQFVDELGGGVWAKVGLDGPPDGFPKVLELPAGKAEAKDCLTRVGGGTRTVVVCTFAKLLTLVQVSATGDVVVEEELRSARFGGVVVDEGHWEPAARWAQAVRALQLPTVLLSATPFRNDEIPLRLTNHSYRFSHRDAVDAGMIRCEEFATLGPETGAGFIGELRDWLAANGVGAEVRVIVRCRRAAEIRECVAALQIAGETAIGVHDSFTSETDSSFRARVPSFSSTDARFWVHQFKLVEGVDDPRFGVLAFHDALLSDREVVQQVGRVLRIGAGDPDRPGWVVCREGADVKPAWDRYRRFDDAFSTADTGAARRVVAAQPAAGYTDRRFRVHIDLESPQLWDRLAYRPAAQIFGAPHLSIENVGELIAAQWRHLGMQQVQVMYPPGSSAAVVTYVRVRNSPALLDGMFLEPELGFTVVRFTEDFVFVYDSTGARPDICEQWTQVERSRFAALLRDDDRVATVSLANTDLGDRAYRSKVLRAASVKEVAAGLTDYAQVCSSALGYPAEEVISGITGPRYIGLTTSRLRDGRQATLTFTKFCDWSDAVTDLLRNSAARASDVFQRYAEPTDVPANAEPEHVLLTLDASKFTDPDGQELMLDSAASEVDAGRFEIAVTRAREAQTVNCAIEWDASRGRYAVSSPELAQAEYRESGTLGRDLIAVINADQKLRVVPKSLGSVYVEGKFFDPVAPHHGTQGQELVRSFVPVAALAKVTETQGEKGKDNIPNGDSWHRESVFGVLDRMSHPASQVDDIAEMRKFFPDLMYLICADMGTEPCDFIAVQEDRVAFIHAKFSRYRDTSASSLHDVVAQALKNLLLLQPAEQGSFPGRQWDGRWPNENGKLRRLRTPKKSDLSHSQLQEQVRKVLRSPNSDREIWVVIAGGIERTALLNKIQIESNQAEILQIYALLQTAHAQCAEAGVKLRVFCRP